MLVWLVDYDGKMENLALMKLSTFHKSRGDEVKLKSGDAFPELFEKPDRVYISCLYRWNRLGALRLAESWGNKSVVGGSGIDTITELPDKVECCLPDYSLYGFDRAIGFLSRGCIRDCPWCIVRRKEGKLKRVAKPWEIVNGFKEVIFLDNNHLALPGHCKDLEWLIENGIVVDFNQGTDARLINDENASLFASLKSGVPGGKIRLALDTVGQINAVSGAIEILGRSGIKSHNIFVYTLIGFDSLEGDIERLLFLWNKKVRVFPMGYRDLETGEEPATGWDRKLYKKYRRLICRMPFAESVWTDFKREVEC